MRLLQWLMRFSGYLLYTLLVLVLMLWLQFPGAAVQKWLEFQLHALTPNLQWKIGGIGLALPADIRLTDIRVSEKSSAKETLLNIDSISLRPYPWSYYQAGRLSAGYQLQLLQGNVSGQLQLAKDHKSLQYRGRAMGIKLAGMKKILQDLDRTVSGTLSGDFTGKSILSASGTTELKGNIKLLKGEMNFRTPVLGMQKLAFNQVSSRLTYGAEGIRLAEGKIESRQLGGNFSGTVKPGADIGRSTLQLNGALIPRPEFLAGLGSGAAVNSLKTALQGGKLAYRVSGTLKDPGIVFTGLPADFAQKLQRGGK